MENTIKLGGKEFKIEINFRKSYELTKYRNKIAMGFDFTGADKKIVEEILKMSQKQSDGENIDISKLSPEAMEFLNKNSKKDLFTFDEIIDITKILTGIETNKEAEELLDAELAESDYDSVIAKLIEKVNLVFTNVKSTSK